MGNLQSQLGSAPSSGSLPPPPPPPPRPVADFPTPTIPGGLEKFEHFPRLALELQAKIWTHALEPHSITSRVVRVIYNTSSSSYTYSFVMPPLLTTCRLSRHVAQRYYPSLIPNLSHPVYFNTTSDFLYCTSTHEWSAIPDQQEVFPILSILNSSSIIGDIRFLALDRSFWSHSYVTNPGHAPVTNSGQLPELRFFTNLEELFLVVPSLEQHLINVRKSFMGIVANPESKIDMLEARCAAAVAHDAIISPSIVPGFRVYQESQIDFLRRWELEGCFGAANLPYFGKSGRGWKNDTYRDKDSFGNQRRVLRCTEIRPCSN
ncbi:hypothetical protein BDZ45DRAFT_316139 [Acephala macrosclerotiorum]|nr:hypothetical protein BDZ45DRAFT_316139 [Acephala macrosclerotiorum]